MKDETGSVGAEYGILIGFIAALIAAGIVILGGQIAGLYVI